MPDLNEAKTRASLINPQLEKAGWNLSDRSQIQFEVPVQGYDPTPWNGFTDFCLYHPDGTVLAVIEAKRTARNAREGEEQLRQYIKEIADKQKAAPFGFITNGLHHFFWEIGLRPPSADCRILHTRRLAPPAFHTRAQDAAQTHLPAILSVGYCLR
jgi:type I site-specific restriction endonuclease